MLKTRQSQELAPSCNVGHKLWRTMSNQMAMSLNKSGRFVICVKLADDRVLLKDLFSFQRDMR